MASLEGSDDSNEGSLDSVQVPEIFQNIFKDKITPFKERLAHIQENKFGDVWSGEREKHEKTMKHAKAFVSDIVEAFRLQYDTVSKEIKGNTCDEFQQYFHKQLNNAVCQTGMLEMSLEQTKKIFDRQIWGIKEKFEKKETEGSTSKSDIDQVISKTELMDPVHVNHALLCCRVAYECKDLENPEHCLKNLATKHWLSELVVSYEDKAVPRYVMARCGDVLYVAFRGLESTLYTSAVGAVIPSTDLEGMGKGNSIIYEEAKKVPLGYFAREIIDNKRIVFTGHSTGGAIASLVSIFLLDNLGLRLNDLKDCIKCITFGMTPFGDKVLRKTVESIRDMNQCRECFCHIVKDDDIIPKLFGSNLEHIQEHVLELIVNLVGISAKAIGSAVLPPQIARCWKVIMSNMPFPGNFSITAVRKAFLPSFDIFGEYYILHPGKEPKFTVYSGGVANDQLSLKSEQVSESWKDYLVNHKIERYKNDVKYCLVNAFPAALDHLECDGSSKPADILPVIEEVQLENFGGEVVAKIRGKNMWFVHAVTIRGLELLSDCKKGSKKKNKLKAEEFPVTAGNNFGGYVEINMESTHLVHFETVNVRVKTHFHRSKYMKAVDISPKTTSYDVSKRQKQLAKLGPTKVIELAFMSALLERSVYTDDKDDGNLHSERYANIEAFFEGVIPVVPVESLFHAMAVSDSQHTLLQCCQMLLANKEFFLECDLSEFLGDGMRIAIMENIRRYTMTTRFEMHLDNLDYSAFDIEAASKSFNGIVGQMEATIVKAMVFIQHDLLSRNGVKEHFSKESLCGLSLEEIYKACQSQRSACSIEHPLTLVKNGRDELNALCENMNARTPSAENANSQMLKKLNDLSKNFQTCSALLGSFMETHVHVPLELQDDKQAKKIITAAESGGLKVWALLVLPISYVQTIIKRFFKGSRKLLVDVASYFRNLRSSGKFGRANIISDHTFYVGKLELLMTSMKRSFSSSKSFIAYSLERQLKLECQKRNIDDLTSMDEILHQWEENFKDEALNMVDEHYRPMVARWIKWSLMINKLREDLAQQTAVGVIGLVNSGKSKFVRSMFGIETITGTVAEKRTTVPYIYNMGDKIAGLDVIDFPGVDDKDKSIPELAKLLLSLSRIVVFVVDYKRAHTEATAQWLRILEEEKVPVLVCLTFADKLFSEYMQGGQYPDNSVVKAKLKEQLKHITDQIGQPEQGKRDFKFVVFDLDNDSCLNTDEGKQKLREAGLHDEIKVGRWIAQELRANENLELSKRVLNFVTEKKSSTLNSHKVQDKLSQKRPRDENGKTETKVVDERGRPSKRRLTRSISKTNDQPTSSKCGEPGD